MIVEERLRAQPSPVQHYTGSADGSPWLGKLRLGMVCAEIVRDERIPGE